MRQEKAARILRKNGVLEQISQGESLVLALYFIHIKAKRTSDGAVN
jgi:hypothetical protein